MLIKVEYTDGSTGMIDGSALDSLIASRAITKFLRSSGWVDVDAGSVRHNAAAEEHAALCECRERRRPNALLNIYV